VDREVVLAVLALCVCTPLAMACGAVPTEHASLPAGWQLERFWWRRVWLPIVPTALAMALLVGWAMQEPDESDEVVTRVAVWLALFFALIWIRAASRAVRSLARASDGGMAAATVGLLRPRVIISPALTRMLDPNVVNAVREHEAAHARHADPLRIWLAQLATDLQWPCPAAHARWQAWREALEFARDDEARSRGADGADLAEAILALIRLRLGAPLSTAAMVGNDGATLRARISRLLVPLPPEATPPRIRPVGVLIVGAGVLSAVACGVIWGDVLIRALPSVGS
jgi:hypothetical protein